MRASKRFPVAVHALLLAASLSDSRRVTSMLIAESADLNAVTVRNIFLSLSDSGLLTASAGKNGGIRLGRPPEEITLWDVYRSVETDNVEDIFQIYDGNHQCPVGRHVYQVLYPHLYSALGAMKADMEQVTIKMLLSELQALITDSADSPDAALLQVLPEGSLKKGRKADSAD